MKKLGNLGGELSVNELRSSQSVNTLESQLDSSLQVVYQQKAMSVLATNEHPC
jgi:hypothetical protein